MLGKATILLKKHPQWIPPGLFRAPLLIASSITWMRKLSLLHPRNLLDCLRPAVLPLQQIVGWLKSPMKVRVCKHNAVSGCLQKASCTCSSESGGLQQDTHYSVIHTGLLFNPHSQDLSWLTIHAQAELCAFQLLSYREGNFISLPSWSLS